MTGTVAFLVNGDPGSAMGERARALASRLDARFPVEIAYRHRNKFLAILLFLQLLLRLQPRLVYVFDMSSSGVVAAAAYRALRRTRWVIDTGDAIYELAKSMGRGSAGRMLTWLLEEFSIRCADRIVVRGRNHVDLLAQKGIAATWIPDGVAVREFAPPQGRELRARLGLEGFLVVGLVGACVWSERWQMCYGWDLVELIGLLKDKKVKGVVIGDGSGLSHLQSRCRDLGIEDRVIFPGRIPYAELPRYLGAVDICLSTQTSDVPGRVRTTGKLPLYLAAGKYVLASRVGEAARILPEKMLVDYVGIKDELYPTRLKERVLKLIQNPADIRCEATTVALAQKYFDYDVLGERLAAALEDHQV